MSVFFKRRGAVPVFAKKASDYAVGESVFLNVNGSLKEFLVVHQGLPSSTYDASCDGTWLLMKDVYENRVWGSGDNNYANSTSHSYLNSTFFSLFDSNVQNLIKQVKIPYVNGTGSSGAVASGANGLSTKIFMLSLAEIGITDSASRTEGTALGYFNGAAASKRIAYLNGNAGAWWLRSPDITHFGGTLYVWSINASGAHSYTSITLSQGIRPCIILPFDTPFDSKTNIFKEV